MFIRAWFLLAHKHKDISTRRMAHLTCAYAYAYVDPVFTCLHMCLCLCLCLCLYLWDNENRTLTHHICRFCWCTHLQNYKGQDWNIRFCWLRTTCCAGENCQAQKIVNEWNVRIIVWTFSNVCHFVRTKLPIRLAKGTKTVRGSGLTHVKWILLTSTCNKVISRLYDCKRLSIKIRWVTTKNVLVKSSLLVTVTENLSTSSIKIRIKWKRLTRNWSYLFCF